MASPIIIPSDLRVEGKIIALGGFQTAIKRSEQELISLAEYPIPLHAWRVWDAYATNLPAVPATDDAGIVGADTFGTVALTLQTRDLKAAGAQNVRLRSVLYVPPEFAIAKTLTLRFKAGMLTTVADTTATIDAELFKNNGDNTIGADLVTTAATTINNLVLANKDFQIDTATLSPGNILDLRVTFAINDAATGTAVKGIIGSASLLVDTQG